MLCYNHFMKSYIDEVLFEEAKNRMYGKVQGEKGIGTLAEKSVHSVLKYYFAPDETFHEQKIGRFVADIRIDGEIYEIQTKQRLDEIEIIVHGILEINNHIIGG